MIVSSRPKVFTFLQHSFQYHFRLCWPLEKLVTFSLNQRTTTDEIEDSLTPAANAALRRLLRPDYVLYDAFKRRFDRLVAGHGAAAMRAELAALRQAKADVVEACAASGTREEEAARRLAVGGGGGVLGSRALCPFYQMDEIEFVNILRERYTRRAQMMQ